MTFSKRPIGSRFPSAISGLLEPATEVRISLDPAGDGAARLSCRGRSANLPSGGDSTANFSRLSLFPEGYAMTHKVVLAAAAAIALFSSVGAGAAFPVAPIQAAPEKTVTNVTFWGKPFPYRYNWRLARGCTRYETVETSRGPVTQRVWVCGQRRDAVVSYRG